MCLDKVKGPDSLLHVLLLFAAVSVVHCVGFVACY